MEGRQTKVDNLSEIFVDGVDSLFAGGPDSGSKVIDDFVDFGNGIALIGIQETL
jgi:hypothetical protein